MYVSYESEERLGIIRSQLKRYMHYTLGLDPTDISKKITKLFRFQLKMSENKDELWNAFEGSINCPDMTKAELSASFRVGKFCDDNENRRPFTRNKYV